MTKHPNTLIIGDTHLPFTHRHYLDFCVDTAKAYGCKRICHVGDSVDHHATSFHDADPNGRSAGDELAFAKKALKPWFKAFPRVYSAIGNHDALIQRQAYAHGVPDGFLKSFKQAYDAPAGWRFSFEWRFGNWRLTHGTGTSGHDAAFKSAVRARISTAQGHIHTAAGVKFHASNADIIWGLQVACGIDRRAYAFNYGRDFLDKPILGCGVVLEGGRIPLFVPMSL
jgi:hypothetical protein